MATSIWLLRRDLWAGPGPGQAIKCAYTALLIQADGAQYGLHNGVGIAVGAGATILEVALAVAVDAARNAYAAATVSHAGAEVVDRARFVLAGQAAGVVLALLGIVGANVTLMALGELGDGLLDFLDAAVFAHRLGGHIGMGASTVPVTWHGLGIQSGDNLGRGEQGYTD